MAYVVVVFAMINALALGAVAWKLMEMWRDLPMYVSTAIGDEVRKQDDRIEKRLSRAGGQAEDSVPTALDASSDGRLAVGRPYRRSQ